MDGSLGWSKTRSLSTTRPRAGYKAYKATNKQKEKRKKSWLASLVTELGGGGMAQ